jgi:hypothetical protein
MSVFQSDPIVLGSSKPFATGDHRLCFKHPSDGSLCVKVNRQGKAQALKANAPLYKKFRSVDSFDDNKIEYRAFQQPAIRRNTPDIWRHIPRCYGWVETDIGPGLVTDFFGGDDQDAAAMTLEYYLQEFGKTPHLSLALEEFAKFLRRYLLLTKNLMPHNLLVLNSDSDNTSADLRLVLVDGFGLSTIFPLAKYVPLLAKRHVEKRLHWLSYRISWEVSDRKLSWLEAEEKFINGAENIHV